MAHKTTINGTNYDVSGGKTLIGGTAYKITGGRTLIGGTAYAISFVAKPEASTLNDCSWENISEVSESGQAANYWSVGDTKTITINGTVGATTFSNLSIDAFIIGIDHNSNVEGANRIHFQLGKINGVDVCLCDSNYSSLTTASGAFTMNTSGTNSGGWSSSHMRTTVLGSDSDPASPTANTLLAALPADLRAVMKKVIKYSDNVGGGSDSASSDVTATEDFLFLLAEFEVDGIWSYASKVEKKYQVRYDYYKAGNSALKYKHDSITTKTFWWLRSTYVESTTMFCRIATDGYGGVASAKYSGGVAPAFAV